MSHTSALGKKRKQTDLQDGDRFVGTAHGYARRICARSCTTIYRATLNTTDDRFPNICYSVTTSTIKVVGVFEDFYCFPDFPMIIMRCFGEDLGLFKQDFVARVLMMLCYCRTGEQT